MSFLRKVKAGLVKIPREDFQADPGQIFYDINTGQMYLGKEDSNGEIINGGVPIGFVPGVTNTDDIPEGTNSLYYTQQRVVNDINSTVTAGFVAALNTDADTLDGLDSTYFATATGLSNLEATVNSLDTDDIPEGTTNFYWTETRFNSSFGNKTTDELTEGPGSLYFTNTRAITAVGGSKNDATTGPNTFWSADRILTAFDNAVGQGGAYGITQTTGTADDGQLIRTNGAGQLDISLFDLNTDEISEASNLYYTDTRAIAAIGGVIDDLGTANNDIWSADKILTELDSQFGAGGSTGIQLTAGVADADKLIRTDASGYLDASFLIGRSTNDLSEGTNLYYTQARFDSAFAAKSTTDLSEGTNLYYTDTRAIAAIGGVIDDLGTANNDIWSASQIIANLDNNIGTGGSVGVQATAGVADADKLIRTDASGYLDASFLIGRSTTDLSEGTNLYYTDTRAIAAIGGVIDDLGTANNDIWSADQIVTNLDNNVGVGGSVGVQATAGVANANTLIRTDATGYLSATFLDGLSTDDLSEGTNLYYTQARFDSAFTAKSTDDLSEGLNNLYYTDARAIAAIGGVIDDIGSTTNDIWSADRILTEFDTQVGQGGTVGLTATTGTADDSQLIRTNAAGVLDPSFLVDTTTDDITEGVNNLYYTDSRVQQAIDLNKFANTFYVDKSPAGENEFSSVSLALAEIAARGIQPGPANQFLIWCGPGTFTVDPFTLPAWVSIKGSDSSTRLIPSDLSVDFITLESDTNLAGLTLDGPTTSGKSTLVIDSTSGSGIVNFENINLGDASGYLRFENATTNNITVLMRFTTVFGAASANLPWRVSASSTGVANLIIDGFGHLVSDPTANINHYMEVQGAAANITLANVIVDVATGVINHMFHMTDSANLIISAMDATGADVTLHADNVGGPSYIRTSGFVSDALTWDLLIEHPGTTGTVTGIMSSEKISVNPVSPLTVSIVNPTGDQVGTATSGDVYQADRMDRLANISKLIRGSATIGVVTGGVVSDAVSAPLDVTISSGNGFVEETVDNYLLEIFWDETTLTLPDDTESWISVEASGVPTVSASAPGNNLNFLLLARVFTRNGAVVLIEELLQSSIHAGNKAGTYLSAGIGPLYVSGSLVSENAVTNSALDVSPGRYFYGLREINPSGGTEVGFVLVYRDGLGGFKEFQNQFIVPDQWDNGTGTLQNLTAGYFAKHSVYVVGEGVEEQYYVVASQTEYADIAVAEQESLPLPPGYISQSIALIASVIVEENNPNINTILDERPIVGFKAGAVSAATTHGNLLGLESDDHPQYLRTDGTRILTGNLDLGVHSISNVTTVNGVTVEAHASRHLPNGADPLATGVPITIGTVNATGVENAFARRDHLHAHGPQPGGTLHAQATPSTDGFMSAADKTRFDNLDTDDVPEGTSNLYYTDTRAIAAIGGVIDDLGTANNDIWSADRILTELDSQFGTSGTVGIQATTGLADAEKLIRSNTAGYLDASFLIGRSTDDLSEGLNNLYYTDARAIAAIGGVIDDSGTATNDIWSADQIITYVGNEITGIQATAGATNANELIRTDAGGYLDASFLGGVTTSDLSEGTNLYYTQSRFDIAFTGKSTSDLTEGTNFYYTDARAIAAIGGVINDAGTATDDIWSASQIITNLDNNVGIGGSVGISATTGIADANTLIRTDASGYLDASFLGGVTTSDLSEGTNLYYTQARFDTAFSNKSTTDLSEGTNLYFTDARAVTAIGGSKNDAGIGVNDLWSADKITSYVGTETAGTQSSTGAADANKLIRTDASGYLDASFLGGITTSDLSEGTNLYYTDTRAIAAIGGVIDDIGTANNDIWSADRILTEFTDQVGTSGSIGIQATAGIADAAKIIRTDASGYLDATFLIGRSTDDLSEGSNLYYTQARFDTAFANKSTDDLGEGVNNLYFTTTRAINAIGGSKDDAGTTTSDLWSADKIISYTSGVQATTGATDANALIRTNANGYLDASFLIGRSTSDLSEGTNLYYTQARFDNAFAAKSTTDLSEGINLYFTNARAVTAIGGQINDAGSGLNDIWSADKIISYVSTESSTSGIQATTGATDADKSIRTDAAGYLDNSFLANTTTDAIAEGTTNLYYTDGRVQAVIDTNGIQTTTGAADSNKGIRTNASGRLDNSFVDLTYIYETSGTTFTTTSTAYVTIDGMTATPPAGTYMVYFNSTSTANSNNTDMAFAIAVDGTVVTNSERSLFANSSSNVFSATIIAVVTVTGTETVTTDLRLTSAGPVLSVFERSFTLTRIGP